MVAADANFIYILIEKYYNGEKSTLVANYNRAKKEWEKDVRTEGDFNPF